VKMLYRVPRPLSETLLYIKRYSLRRVKEKVYISVYKKYISLLLPILYDPQRGRTEEPYKGILIQLLASPFP